MLKKITVTVTPTSSGIGEYIQIISDDSTSVNIVLIADKIEVKDSRSKQDKIASEKE